GGGVGKLFFQAKARGVELLGKSLAGRKSGRRRIGLALAKLDLRTSEGEFALRVELQRLFQTIRQLPQHAFEIFERRFDEEGLRCGDGGIEQGLVFSTLWGRTVLCVQRLGISGS